MLFGSDSVLSLPSRTSPTTVQERKRRLVSELHREREKVSELHRERERGSIFVIIKLVDRDGIQVVGVGKKLVPILSLPFSEVPNGERPEYLLG